MIVVGLSAFHHDSAAAIVRDGVIVAAAEEERFTRQRHDSSFPANAVRYCLQEAGVRLADVDRVVFHERPAMRLDRMRATFRALAPRGFGAYRATMPFWTRQLSRSRFAEGVAALGGNRGIADKLSFVEHQASHAASAFFPSPFDEAAVLTVDGAGEWATTAAGVGRGSSIELTRELRFPHSLGLLYSAFTHYAGFHANSGEQTVMGLAAHGEARYASRILDTVMDLKEDGSFRLDLGSFDLAGGRLMTNERFAAVFGGPARQPRDALLARHVDLAASIQAVTEEVMLRLTRALARETGQTSLALAGAIGLNCVANGKLLRDRAFRRIWIQPASGDSGGAIGAALAGFHQLAGAARESRHADGMSGAFLGPSFTQAEIEARLLAVGGRFVVLPEEAMNARVADALAGGNVVGWFQGRMEFGPSALGARSVLADPRSAAMQSAVNVHVKHREAFRPLAAAVTREQLGEWLDLDADSPYMLLVATVAGKGAIAPDDASAIRVAADRCRVIRSTIPAVTHVDHSVRIQTVHRETHPRFHALLESFRARTGCAVLMNSSFNVSGEPIVCTPEDAFRCFMGSQIDRLVVGNCLLVKERQDRSLATFYPSVRVDD